MHGSGSRQVVLQGVDGVVLLTTSSSNSSSWRRSGLYVRQP